MKQKSLRIALAAELSSVTVLIWKRGYLDALRSHIDSMKRNRAPGFFQVRISKDYDVVFKSNAHRIGTIPPGLTRRVTIVYYWMSAIKEDLDLLTAAAAKTPGTELLWELEKCIAFHEQLLELSESTIPLMDEAVRRLERRDRRGWPVESRLEKIRRKLRDALFGHRYPEDDIE